MTNKMIKRNYIESVLNRTRIAAEQLEVVVCSLLSDAGHSVSRYDGDRIPLVPYHTLEYLLGLDSQQVRVSRVLYRVDQYGTIAPDNSFIKVSCSL